MEYILQINNKTKTKISKKEIKAVFRETIESALGNSFLGKNFELSLALVNEEEIRLLNRQYRRKDRPTDVLSFAEFENLNKLPSNDAKIAEDDIFMGELIVCPEYIRKNAIEDKESFDFAMAYIISHGILHLLGFPHGKKMFSLQMAVAEKMT